MSDTRKPLISLWRAHELYGSENVSFSRPQYVPDGYCQWCGKEIKSKRRHTTCSPECKRSFDWAVTWGRGRGAYSTHMLRRDNFTCQICGEFHAMINSHGVRVPTSDGNLDLHHVVWVSKGGTDAPENLKTVCTECHKDIHRGGMTY